MANQEAIVTTTAPAGARPLCFVLMPFGQKPDSAGALVDFDAVYRELIRPAIDAAGLEPIRADEEMTGGIIHKPMFERLVMCEYAVADLTTANANVFYELGVRHAVRPWSTVLVYAEGGRLPFDVAPLRAIPYRLEAGKPANVEPTRAAIVKQLEAARERAQDSPVFQLLEWTSVPDVAHMKTDVFRERAEYSSERKAELAAARAVKPSQDARVRLNAIEQSLGSLKDNEAGVVIDLFLSYRAVKGFDDMVRLVDRMDPALRDTVMVQEQLGLALNRLGRRDDAEKVLTALIKRRGPSSETYGILGRVYKDRWEEAAKAGDAMRARGLLEKAINAYLRGFEADQRDAYPGINVVTLMELREPPDPRGTKLTPVVRYAVERKMANGTPDYWDYATLVELAVLAGDADEAISSLSRALAEVRESFEPETTARNLRLIREARERRGEAEPWLAAIEDELNRAAKATAG
jgi:tetratricopeptide (TPR) repeat protein